MANRLADETSPYLLQHKDNPVDWHPWGEQALARGARARRADPALDRLLGLPLVPRDGARVVRGPGDRRLHERALRLRQGRPRGAARRRRDLHGRRAGDDRPRRLAAERVPDARAGAVLRRHLLPADEPRHGMPSWRQMLEAIAEAWERARATRSARQSERIVAPPRRRRPDRAVRRAAVDTELLDDAVAAIGARSTTRRTAASAARRSSRRRRRSSCCCAAASAEPAARHAARDGGGRHLRPARRRLRPLHRRRRLARPPLREDALRQRAARARVPARLAGHAATSCSGASAARRSTGRCARCAGRRAASTRRSTPTPRATRASSTSGRSRSCARRSATSAASRAIAHFGVRPGRELRGQDDPRRAAGDDAAELRGAPPPRCSPRASSACGRASTTSA